MRRSSGFFNLEGLFLEYQALGPVPGKAPTLVFLHEGLGCVAMWKDFPERVARMTGCGVLAYSRAGYGKSGACSLPRPLSFMHTEALTVLPRVLDAAGIGEAVLVGHSDGASIALIHAGGAGDERVKGLILAAPHVFVEDLTLESIRAAAEAYENGGLRDRLARYHGENLECAFRGWSGAWLDPRFSSWNIETFLPGIAIPTLLIQGEDDCYGTPLQLEAIARQVPGGVERLILPDCGHSPHRDQPEATLRAIADFVGKLRGGSPPKAQGARDQ